jgi:hypothetical protein
VTPEELADRLERAAKQVPPAVRAAVKHEGTLLRSLIQAHASGRPGPNIVTTRYHASWRVLPERIANGTQVVVGTEAVQGPRLEFGFVGTDSLGRTYNQPPYPHVGPAIDEFRKKYPDMIMRAVREAIER